ncbi:hypothetical protein A8C56_20870 [Niabella ginsenosidivorans]|uniref:PBCV-specific basic adaptor domain-containing protein n=1 Tax=Niabella ginsenosidivorans TaxID=1176587 RepID=A0A1A9I6Z4_9BACT|nr:DUF3157 family protein [Niabella ginsenosidivorans]ANH83105.1 hypothetical protein A8C56_20870 [Niabella ginsenosidivorans]
MSRVIQFLMLSLFTHASCAQKKVKHIVKTTDGATVKLYSNYTWEYVSEQKPSVNNKNVGINNAYSSDFSKSSTAIKKKTTTRKSTAGRVYYRGKRGGCYYLTSGGNKVYVDRSLCN